MAMEERTFTKAEQKFFSAKYETFQTAQRAVDEVVVMLREQYGIAEDEQGWQIGQNGFFRMKEDAPPAGFDALPQGQGQSDEDTKRQTSKGDNTPPTGEEAKGKK